jgi:predicted RNA-binding protein with PIN domain
MSAEDKAKELYFKMLQWQDTADIYIERNVISITAKQCALICVDEMLDIRNALYINEGSLAHQWLLDVRQEIEKL